MALDESGGQPSTLPRPADHVRNIVRLVASVLACLAVVVAVSVGVAAALTRPVTDHDPQLTGLDRSQRVGVSTAYFVVVFAAIAYGLRRLQRRGSI